jgi:hypothetical protein
LGNPNVTVPQGSHLSSYFQVLQNDSNKSGIEQVLRDDSSASADRRLSVHSLVAYALLICNSSSHCNTSHSRRHLQHFARPGHMDVASWVTVDRARCSLTAKAFSGYVCVGREEVRVADIKMERQMRLARVPGYPHYGSRLISGLSYKTAFSNELLTSIFPL